MATLSPLDEVLVSVHSQPVVFFSKENCVYCDMLETDLISMEIPYKKVMLTNNIRSALVEYTKCLTVPQLFIGGVFHGGYKEFSTLSGTGRLESLLSKFGIIVSLDF